MNRPPADSTVTADEKNSLDPAWVAHQLEHAAWFSNSTGGSNCVEVAFLDHGLVATRDSLNPHHSPQLYSEDEWTAFIDGAKNGRFDRKATSTS
ncbi:DUF397 domain-containing protein [Streptomyces sp. TLI_171]|uniref:DUF397 domain-containing protein n=1 Tax=Streptomyces sp. TLI_171 TaxID=1938859 RepID=UPI000C537D66|nr:DUF397 domain-containing protein [Streptomyces sp. TLI_171]RKE21956.1 uncharacterized protein DUF397 [Streptomyces sp. TLI_171]